MSAFSRFFRKPVPSEPISQPDDSQLRETIKEAKRDNTRAVSSFMEATQKQERDANFTRRVVSDVLRRAESLKVSEHHAGIQK